MRSNPPDSPLLDLMHLIAANQADEALLHLGAEPHLARRAAQSGATRSDAERFFLADIQQYIFAGDTALHIAAAAFRTNVVEALLQHDADCFATNRRGAQPLHYASDTNTWAPDPQSATIHCLLHAGADPNAKDANGSAPLHRAIRARSAPAVRALLSSGASPHLRNKAGSTPLHLAVQSTGRSGSGSPRSREQQELIISLLLEHGAMPDTENAHGKTARDLAPLHLRRLLPLGPD